MRQDGSTEEAPTADPASQEPIDAFLDREFAAAFAEELAGRAILDGVRDAIARAAAAPSPSKKAWLDAVSPPPQVAADG